MTQWQGLVSPADQQTLLTSGLSEHVLHELHCILAACETDAVRNAIVTEVLRAVEQFGDRALIVALARVSYDNNDSGPSEGVS